MITAYWFERSMDSLFSSPLIDSTVADTTVGLGALASNQTYWCRVRAKNVSGYGLYSTPRKFTVTVTGIEIVEEQKMAAK